MVIYDIVKTVDIRHTVVEYFDSLISIVPVYVFQILLCILLVGIVTSTVWKGVRNGFIFSIRILFFELVFIIYCSTVFFRSAGTHFKYDFHPFWSYDEIKLGKLEFLAENIMNVLVFIPVGMLIGLGFPKWLWWKAIGVGCLISISIEVLQFIFKRGFSEIDDIIHNTLGCAIGFGIYAVARYGYERICKRSVESLVET